MQAPLIAAAAFWLVVPFTLVLVGALHERRWHALAKASDQTGQDFSEGLGFAHAAPAKSDLEQVL